MSDKIIDPRKILTGRKMKEMMAVYYLEAKNAEHNNQRLGWITSGAPVEVLLAMDIIPIYPENHGAMCAIQKMAVGLQEEAEKLGYSRDLCSYARTDFGQIATGMSPIAGLPKPDFLFAASNICGTVIKWYEIVARHYDVPLFVVDLPFVHEGEPDRAMLDYVKTQLREFIAFLEDLYKTTFDWDRFQDVLIKSAEGSRLWGDVLKSCAHVPAPMSCFDAFILMAPIVTLRGTQETIDFYTELSAEMKDRIDKGIAVVPDEKFRLLWDNLPIWFIMKDFSQKLSDWQTILVAATYTSSWAAMDFDPADAGDDWEVALDHLSRAYLGPYINSGFDRRVEILDGMIKQYNADGFIMHSDRSCKPYSVGQYQIRDRVYEKTGVQGLVIEADMADSRVYAEGATMTRIEAYLESLEVRH